MQIIVSTSISISIVHIVLHTIILVTIFFLESYDC